jgi:hypothetical protein
VRKKNRKLRRIRELYPDIKIKLFYARDFRAMMLKYGRFGLFESLSGTTGQVFPERAAIDVVVPATETPMAAPESDLDAPRIVRAAPRSRPGRRRRGPGVGIETGAEREAGT